MSSDRIERDKKTEPSRRTFIKAAAGAAAAVAAGRLVAADAASDPLRIGVVGTGRRGCGLMRNLDTIEGATIAAICDDYEPHLKYGREVSGDQARSFDRFEEMLELANLDAVLIATPLRSHFPMCMAAIDRGLAVFCEKAMCYSIDEAKQLASRVEERGAVFQLGLQRRSNPVYEQAEAMIRSGMLGTLTAIKCQWHMNDNWRRPVPVKPEHRNYAALDRKLNWWLYAETSQGLMAELGSHQVDVANRLLERAPSRVTGQGGIDRWQDGREMDDNVFCTYEYDMPRDGEIGTRTVRVTHSSMLSNAYEGVSELVMGTQGTLLLTQKKAFFYVEGMKAESGPLTAEELAVDGLSGATQLVSDDPWAHRGGGAEIDSKVDDTRAQLVSFLRDVRAGNRDTACDVRIGLENTATVLIANEAIRTGRPVSFPDDCRRERTSA